MNEPVDLRLVGAWDKARVIGDAGELGDPDRLAILCIVVLRDICLSVKVRLQGMHRMLTMSFLTPSRLFLLT